MSNDKNRERDAYTFANINLLGKCNVDCFFCLGKDIEDILCKQNQLKVHFNDWKNFDEFLTIAEHEGIKKIYLTGQNTDPLLYPHLPWLIEHIQERGFTCGIRTNGYKALDAMESIKLCKDEIGYSIHSFNPITNQMILGRRDIPDWDEIMRQTEEARISIVLNRCNEHEFFDTLHRISELPGKIPYVQVRRVSTDTREKDLAPDVAAFERTYTTISRAFRMTDKLWEDAEVYDIYGMPVVFWRTVKTSVNSMNYFTDGTISRLYFVIEGYLKNRKRDE